MNTDLKVLIVDDEALARERLKSLIEELGFEIAAEASNGEQALEMIHRMKPDLALLDIQMPGLSGLDVAKKLKQTQSSPAVIFTTAYDRYALSAFDVDAIDYLLKPIRRDRLRVALEKVRKVQALTNDGYSGKHIYAQQQGRIQLVPIEEVIYFRAEHKYITVRHTGGEVLIDDSLKRISEEYPDQFIRIHRNALVSPKYILSMEKESLSPHVLALRGVEDRLDVSRRHVAEVRKVLKNL